MSPKKAAAVGDRLPYLLGKLKTPRVLERLEQTAATAREEGWPYEQFLEVLLEAEVFARDASGSRNRIRHAAFPAHKTLEDFDFTGQPAAEKPLIFHLAQLAWGLRAHERLLLRAPGTGKTHLAIALASKACQVGHRVAFQSAQQWIDRLEQAQHRNTLDAHCGAWSATACWWSTRSATSTRTPSREPALRAATNAARSSSPATAASKP